MEKKCDAVLWHLPLLECLHSLSSREVGCHTQGWGQGRTKAPSAKQKEIMIKVSKEELMFPRLWVRYFFLTRYQIEL